MAIGTGISWRPALLAAILAATVPMGSVPARAAGAVRDNPFLPDTTAEEDKRIAERNLVAATLREMLPEMRADMQRYVEDHQKGTMDGLRQQLQSQQSAIAALPRAAAMAAAPAAKAAAASPGKYVSCINDKAVYRREDGSLVKVGPTAEEPHPCQ